MFLVVILTFTASQTTHLTDSHTLNKQARGKRPPESIAETGLWPADWLNNRISRSITPVTNKHKPQKASNAAS
jgi:hypothetical protein